MWEIKKWTSDGEYSTLHPYKTFDTKNAMVQWILGDHSIKTNTHKFYHNNKELNRVEREMIQKEVQLIKQRHQMFVPPFNSSTGKKWYDYSPYNK
jgi:hypothetical protein